MSDQLQEQPVEKYEVTVFQTPELQLFGLLFRHKVFIIMKTATILQEDLMQRLSKILIRYVERAVSGITQDLSGKN